ncbi:MAG: Bifunctional protein GlmU [Fimbriimonadaceae bacterium]|nr:Bifunctional protein GlmU [Fimbriimonadaceae bacterium]
MTRRDVAAIILAAGKGTRMKSDLPKGLHPIMGLSIVECIVRSVRKAGIDRIVVVIGHQAELMEYQLAHLGVTFAHQSPQLGTGHAAMQARDALAGHNGPVMVLPGDTPLITEAEIGALVDAYLESAAAAAMLTFEAKDPSGYGRIIRDPNGHVAGIVEERDASSEQRKIQEVNPAMYIFTGTELWETLPKLSNSNAQGEYYLTDAIGAIAGSGKRVTAVSVDPDSVAGVNDRWQLAQLSSVLRMRLLKTHALAGVTIADPETTWIGPDVELSPDVCIEPSTILMGRTSIGAGSTIGPNTRVVDTRIGMNCIILMSHLNSAVVEDDVRCGPFANLRPGTILRKGVRIGNFVEVKNAELGEQVSASHLTYLGDSTIGARSNIGAGTITCNYDGFDKNRTEIGEGAFIGSNSTLIAPVHIGNGAFVAAGSTINRDVPADAMAIGRSQQEVKEEWAKRWRQRKAERSS